MSGDLTSGERRRLSWLIILPLVIAGLTLVSQSFQSFNYARNIESAQRNVLRAEALRTCRDIIDVFFQFRLKAEEASHRQGAGGAMLGAEMKSLASKFGAFGTFLANFQDDDVRYRYTVLARDLAAIAEAAGGMTQADLAARFVKAEEAFGKLNEDCVKAAQAKLV
jgi:hypothetical protein